MKTRILLLLLALISVNPAGRAQESEFKDTPYFSGMPNYTIYDAEDLEFDGYNFFNGKNCTTVEGKKLRRVYVVKEDATKSSVIQIMRNYANAIRNMGGSVVFEGEPQEAECAEFNGLNMVVGKAVKDRNEMWIEIATLGRR